ncbi:MAG TPA: hypothetical protein ENK27_05925, partial [Desulfobulbus sp.]|nr:hypothetical protein [Desulfobulbus sp.]
MKRPEPETLNPVTRARSAVAPAARRMGVESPANTARKGASETPVRPSSAARRRRASAMIRALSTGGTGGTGREDVKKASTPRIASSRCRQA